MGSLLKINTNQQNLATSGKGSLVKIRSIDLPTPKSYATVPKLPEVSSQHKEADLELPTSNAKAPNIFSRTYHSVSGGAKQFASGQLGAIGTYTEAAGKASEAAARATANSGRLRSAEREADRLRALAASAVNEKRKAQLEREADRAERKAKAVTPVAVSSDQTDAIAKNLYNTADALSESGAADVERAKEGAGFLGGLAVDLGAQATQMLGDRLVGGVTGLGGLAPMLVRSFGSGAQEARKAGASLARQVGYGAASAAVEGITEKMFDGVAGIYGKGAADDVVANIIDRVAKNDAAKRALTIGAAAAGESAEEFASGIVNPMIRAIYNGKTVGQNYSETQLADIGYDMLVGGLLGAIGGSVQTMRGSSQRQTARNSLPFDALARQSTAESNLTPAQTEGAEARKTGNATAAPQAQENAAIPNETTAVNTDPAEHTAAEQAVINEYQSSVDDSVRAFYENAQKNGRGHIDLSPVSERSATDIARLIGKDVRGFKTTFEERQAAHIKKDHGADGLADHSMADSNDVARIQYVLDNYDSVADGGRTQAYWETAPNGRNRTARTVVFSKKVNGTYYIVEAAPVTNARSVYIVSAYMSDKNNAATPTHLPDANPPGFTADTDNAPSVATIDATIPQPSNAVKTHLDLPTPGNSQTIGNLAEAEQTSEGNLRDALPYKAQTYLERAERSFLRRVGDALSIPAAAQKDSLKSVVQAMSDEYLRSGNISQNTIDNLFEQAYKQGIVIDSEFYDQYKEIKQLLRTTPVSLGEDFQADIPDYKEFRKNAFGTLRIKNDGTPVDIVYEDMRARAPELFPASVTYPAEQLLRLYEVGKSIARTENDLAGFYGEQVEDFKHWAKNDFQNAVNDSIADLRVVKRYSDEKRAKSPEITEDSLKSAFHNIGKARKAAERVKAKNLMTEYDNAQVDKLLKGEIELADLDPQKANVKGIREVFEASKEYEDYARTIKEFNKQRKAKLLDEADQFLTTANDWKDKPAGLLYSRETMTRNIRDIVKDKDLANQIIARYFTPVHESQAESTRFKNRYRDRVRDLNLSRTVAKGNTVSEAHAVQLLGEAEDNIRVLNERGKAGETRDGKTVDEWEAARRELWEQNPNLDREKIENAVKAFRTIYDELFDRMNEVRVRNGYEPVSYHQGYFPHFQPGETEGVIASFAKALGIDTDVQTLPTTINGLTHTFRPGITWFGNAQERLGFNTAYDAVEGFDKYIEGVSDVIHQTDNIQRLRALAQQIRYRTGDEGIRKQMDDIRADNALDEETKNEKLDSLKESGRYSLGNFVVELDEYTNQLANKKSHADRQMEHDMGRRSYRIMKWLEGRVASNMVTVNPGSWLTNFIPLTQGWATLDTKHLLEGMVQTLKAYKTDDGMVYRSTFLTNRRGSDPIVKAWTEKVSEKLSSPMEFIDQFTADSLVRARVLQNTRQGLSEDAAIREADAWAAGIMADRSKGAMPTIFNRKNPVTKLFTQFQLEVNNEFSNLFKDLPDELKEKGAKALAVGLLKFFVGAWLFNEVYEYIVGRRAAFDPLGIINDTAGDLTGYELPNLIEGGIGLINGEGVDIFKTEKAGTYQTVANLAGSAAEELPFVGGVLGGGRVPISSALPDVGVLAKAAVNDQWSGRKRFSAAAKEISAPATYLALPFGGGQIKKIYQGLNAVIKGGSYSVDSQGRDILQYPVYNDSPGDVVGNSARAVLFGKSSLPGAREWVESGFDSFSAKETAVYQGMNDAGVSDRDAIALLRELETVQKTDEQSANTIKRRIIMESSLTGNGKSVAYYGLIASEKERALMDELSDVADMGIATQMLSRIKDSSKSKDKYTAIYSAEMPELAKRMTYRTFFGENDEDTLNKLVAQGVGIDNWLLYKAQTADLTADKDSDGKTISGSLKAKEMAVIDALPLTREAKDALYLATGHTEQTLDDAPWNQTKSLALPGVRTTVDLSLPTIRLPAQTGGLTLTLQKP